MIKTSEKSALREKLLDACIEQKQSLINDFKIRIHSLLETEGLGNEEEYDNTELSQKGQASEEINLLNNALSMANEDMNVLQQLKASGYTPHETAGQGAIVITNKGRFFVSAGIEQLAVDGENFIALSAKSPLFLAMKGLPKGSKFQYNHEAYKITDIF